MSSLATRLILFASICCAYLPTQAGYAQDENWIAVGGDRGGMRYSELTGINRDNIKRLAVAWEFKTGELAEGKAKIMECTPIVVDGVMYITSGKLKVFALNAATGEEIWSFDPFAKGPPKSPLASGGVNRGVAYWSDGIDGGQRRILHGTSNGQLFSLDAKTGQLDAKFGVGGVKDLREDLDGDFSRMGYGPTSAPAILDDIVIMGFSCGEGPGPAAPGDIRAFDVRTGKQVWRFHTVPRPGEFGNDTWAEESWKNRGAANAWGGYSVDTERGLVFAGLGSAAFDFYGGDRGGENLFANCTIALDGKTGKRKWHFQTLHHDLWDHDIPTYPNLVRVTHDGKEIDAVAQVTKTGYVFLFDREKGKPLFEVREQPAPASNVAGEQAWPTQPVPVKPPPFSRVGITREDVTNIAPENQASALKQFDALQGGPQFTPPSLKGTIVSPGFHGGATWSGASFDPESGILYVNSNNQPNIVSLVEQPEGSPTPYRITGYNKFVDHEGYPAVKPPWGQLSAIDLNKGEILWQSTLGEYPELTKRGIPQTGTENFGGTIVTAGGLVFIGGTRDEKLHAFDKTTGELLWEAKLPAGGYATPSTYMVDGQQYVVIPASGGGKLRTKPADSIIAFAIPRQTGSGDLAPLASVASEEAKRLFKAAREGNIAVVNELLDAGLDVNTANAYGANALMFACSRGQVEVVKLLLDRGANPNAKDTFYSATAMSWAAMKQHTGCALVLLKFGNPDSATALMLAAMSNDAESVEWILKNHRPELPTLQRVKAMPQVASEPKLAELFADVPGPEPKDPGEIPTPETKSWTPDARDLEAYVGRYALLPADLEKQQDFKDQFAAARESQDTSGLEIASVVVDLNNLSLQRDDSDATLKPKSEHEFEFGDSTFRFVLQDEQVKELLVTVDGETRSRFRRFDAPGLSYGSAESLAADLEISSSDWMQFRGNGARGVAEGQNPPVRWNVPEKKNVLWKTPVEGLAHSCPVIVGDKLFLTTAISSGDQAGLRTGLYGDVDSVEDNSEHRFELHCYNKKNGELLWKQVANTASPKVKRHLKSTHANPTPATDGKYVVTFFGSEGLYCYTVGGELVWNKDFGMLDSGWFFDASYQWGFAASPIIYNGKVIVQCDIQEGSFLASFDVATGDEVWRREREEIPSWSTPIVVETEVGPQLVTNATNYARAYNPETGEEIWRIGKNSEIAVPTPFAAHGLIYVVSGYRPVRPIYAIRPTAKGDISDQIGSRSSPSMAWQNRRSGSYMTTPVVYGDYFYTCNSAGVLECLDAKTGKRIYRRRVATSEATSFIAALLAADGHIYLPSEEGITLVIKAGPKFELVAENPIGESLHATPAISDGVMYIRGGSHLFAIREEAAQK